MSARDGPVPHFAYRRHIIKLYITAQASCFPFSYEHCQCTEVWSYLTGILLQEDWFHFNYYNRIAHLDQILSSIAIFMAPTASSLTGHILFHRALPRTHTEVAHTHRLAQAHNRAPLHVCGRFVLWTQYLSHLVFACIHLIVAIINYLYCVI